MNRDLDKYKLEINLTKYMASFGYVLWRKDSSKNSVAMVKGEDKLIVAKGYTGFWIYFSIRDDSNNGTILDFHQYMTGDDWINTKRALNSWLGDEDGFFKNSSGKQKTKPKKKIRAENYILDLEPTDDKALEVIKQYHRLKVLELHPYLTAKPPEGRNINPKILLHKRFWGSMRQDYHGNVIFPHQDENNITGWEMKNRGKDNMGFTGFSRGGRKSLWKSNSWKTDNQLVITETGIDALSHAQKHFNQSDSTRYVSLAGAISDTQPKILEAELEKFKTGKILIATDNDQYGEELAEKIKQLAKNANLTEENIIRSKSPIGKDWNNALVTNEIQTEPKEFKTLEDLWSQ